MYRAGVPVLYTWPDHLARHPTPEEWELAVKRMEVEVETMREEGYAGDWGANLAHTILTYRRDTWWHLFFPDEPKLLSCC